MAQVKDLLVKGQAKFLRKAYFQDQIVSNVAQGTAPLVVASSTVVSNLNSDYLDGYHASGLFTALSANSTLSITIGGTTLTSSINAATVDGKYISNYYTKSEADNRFVNVTGDTMSGTLIFSGVAAGNYTEGIRIQDASNKWAVITFGATGTTGCSPQSGEVAWVAAKEPGGKFLISPNTSSDTVGLRLEKDGNAYWRNNVILHSGNYTSYLGYIGTTAVQASSATQALSGITSINSRLSINAESDNTRLGFGGVHGVTFGEPGYAHRIYYFRPAYGANGATYTELVIQSASAAASPTFTTTHKFDHNGNAYHSGNIYLDTGDSDRYIQFSYNSNNFAGASWRLLSRGSGSGDTNYFDIEAGGSNATNNTWYRVIRLTMDNKYVGIGTDLPECRLHIAGDSYTTGWSRAAYGFYVEKNGVYFTHQGNIGEIDMTSTDEFLWGSSTATLYFNHRAVSRGTTVSSYIWNAGSSDSYANHTLGNLISRGNQTLYGLTATCNSGNSASYMQAAVQIREYGFGGEQSDTWGNAPRLAWHWLSRAQAQIGLSSNGHLYISEDESFSTPRLILHSGNTYVSNGKGIINGSTITKVSNADTVDYKHASDFAPAEHTHDERYQVISSATASGITYLATGSYSSIHISTGSGGTMSFSSTPASGKDCHIVIYNSGSSNITITLPSSYRRNVSSITIESSAFGEVNVLNAAGTIYVRAV